MREGILLVSTKRKAHNNLKVVFFFWLNWDFRMHILLIPACISPVTIVAILALLELAIF